jgi:ribosomal protein S18 acetylase RimI-like enzyme
MSLSSESLTDRNLNEVIEFFRQRNPSAQKTWGWDTGRFMDWRWGSNILRQQADPGWFERNCRVFRDGAAIRAVSVSEYGRDDECIITAAEDAEAVRHVLDRLVAAHGESGLGLGFEIAERAGWLRSLFAAAGLEEQPSVGYEFEFDLSDLSEPAAVGAGFTVTSLADDRAADYAGIAECIKAAFNIEHDVAAVLENLEANPMFRPELSIFARTAGGRIAAYCRGTVDPANGVCGIDPVGTHPDFGRMGLGRAVVQACLRTQRDLGGRFSYIGSDKEPAPGAALYRSLGPSDRIGFCRWSLSADHVAGATTA